MLEAVKFHARQLQLESFSYSHVIHNPDLPRPETAYTLTELGNRIGRRSVPTWGRDTGRGRHMLPKGDRRASLDSGGDIPFEGCTPCSERSTDRMRLGGAVAAGAGIDKSSLAPEAMLSRRDVIALAAKGIVLVGAATSVGVSPSTWRRVAAATSADSVGLAWLLGASASSKSALASVDSQGELVIRAPMISSRVLQTEDDARTIALEYEISQLTSQVRLHVYDAATGGELKVVAGNQLGMGPNDVDIPFFALSADGRYAGVLHQALRNATATPKSLDGARVAQVPQAIDNFFEIVDLQVGAPGPLSAIAAGADFAPGAQVIRGMLNGDFYVITQDRFATQTIRMITGGPSGPVVSATATSGQQGCSIPPFNLGLPWSRQTIGDGSVVVRAQGKTVQWLDLSRMTVVAALKLAGLGTENVRSIGGIGATFSPDRSTLVVASPVFGSVQAVDLRARLVRKSAALPGPRGDDSLRGYFKLDSVAISQGNDRIIALDGRATPVRMWTLGLADLGIRGSEPVGLSAAVWMNQSGTVFLATRDRATVQAGASATPASAATMSSIVGFVTPDQVWF